MKKFLKIFFIIFLISTGIFFKDNLIQILNYNLEDFLKGQNKIQTEILQKDLQIEFCPSKNCFDIFNKSFSKSTENIYCAFFDLREENLLKTLKQKSESVDIKIVVDKRYLKHIENYKKDFEIFSNTNYSKLMHHKFCVIDNKTLVTGSTNPTKNGFFRNNNNIIKIKSNILVKNYLQEFAEFTNNRFSTKKLNKTKNTKVILKFENKTYKIENYFCPKDECLNSLLNTLNKAENEILFSTFVITENKIENLLIEKSKNITVKGLIEKRNRNTLGSKIKELNQSFEIRLDKNKGTMHNKFFIIDKKIVITGSTNPTHAGTIYNDENILIIENKKIANLYYKNFLENFNS